MPRRINYHHYSTTTMFMIILNELQVTHTFNLNNTNMSFHQNLRHCEVKTEKKIPSCCLISKRATRAWIRLQAHVQEYQAKDQELELAKRSQFFIQDSQVFQAHETRSLTRVLSTIYYKLFLVVKSTQSCKMIVIICATKKQKIIRSHFIIHVFFVLIYCTSRYRKNKR